jgi:hypothetical protein
VEEQKPDERTMIVPPGQKFTVSAEDPSLITQTGAENFGFVMNVSRLVGATSFSMAAGHELRRANIEEIETIRKTLQPYTIFPAFTPWEFRSDGGRLERLPEIDWHYHVISFQGHNQTLVEVEKACMLAPLEIKIGFTVFRSFGPVPLNGTQHGLIVHAGRLFQMMDRAFWKLALLDVSAADVESIRVIHSHLLQHDARLVDVNRLIQQLQELDAVPYYSPLRFLGYFAVLEALLTHPPKPTDPYDSITRQIKKKMTLLNNRCTPQIDYSAFGDTDTEKVWSTMYTYRSALAHGGQPTFDGDLRKLGSHENALKLVKHAVKAVIRQALVEPQLLLDLKDC